MPTKLADVLKLSNKLSELHRRITEILDGLPADTFLSNEELAEKAGCTVRGGLRKFSSQNGQDYQCILKDGPLTVRFWGNKKSIAKLRQLRSQAGVSL